jgi:hypothetical protein
MNDKPDFTPKSNEAQWHILLRCMSWFGTCFSIIGLASQHEHRQTRPARRVKLLWSFNSRIGRQTELELLIFNLVDANQNGSFWCLALSLNGDQPNCSWAIRWPE